MPYNLPGSGNLQGKSTQTSGLDVPHVNLDTAIAGEAQRQQRDGGLPGRPSGMQPVDHQQDDRRDDWWRRGRRYARDGPDGPDTYGYRWKDSDAPGGPAFDFVDISTTGRLISFNSSDGGYSPAIAMGMTFPFYGNNFSSIRAYTNGFLSFDTTDSSTRLTNYNLPSTSGAKNMLALLWDDLHLRNGNVRYLYDGSRFIVQYTRVQKYSTSAEMTFQVQLYPSGKILYMYQTIPTTVTTNSLTIGIQDGTKTIGLPVVYNAPYVHSGLAVQFTRVPDWLTVTPGTVVIIPPGGTFVPVDECCLLVPWLLLR